jgi:hypothetical protein
MTVPLVAAGTRSSRAKEFHTNSNYSDYPSIYRGYIFIITAKAG